MEIGLSAPLAVAVEVSDEDRRVFRLSSAIGVDEVELERPSPFEPGRVVTCRFALPDVAGGFVLPARVRPRDDADAVVGGSRLAFVAPPPDVRAALAAYVRDRLGLPPPPGASPA